MIWVKSRVGSEGRVCTEGSLKRLYNTANWIKASSRALAVSFTRTGYEIISPPARD